MFDTHVSLTPILMVVVTAFVVPFATFLGRTAIAEGVALAKPYVGQKTALLIQQRANEMFDKGIGFAAQKYLPELQAQGLSIDVGNLVAKQVAEYVASHATDLVPQISTFEGALEEKAKARLIAHPAIQAAVVLANDNLGAPVQIAAAAA